MRSDGNHIYFDEKVIGDPLNATAALHNLITKQGYADIILDFSRSTHVSPDFMLPFTTICRKYRRDKVDFDIIMPENRKTASLLSNTNWAHLIDPDKYLPKNEDNISHLSARQFMTPEDHYRAVDDSVELILRSLDGIGRNRIKALEWAINEITDNVLNHSDSPVGGIIQVMAFKNEKKIDFLVCDAGITIPQSLRSGQLNLRDDPSLLRAAIEEGVTKNRQTNQGNGLFGTFKCCEVSGGKFSILSGMVSLSHKPGQLSVSRNKIPFPGTYIRASISYDYEKLLERALVFRGRPHVPIHDYVDRQYMGEADCIQFVVKDELKAFGTRESGRSARTKILNLMDNGRTAIEFDFSDVSLISSSFADEVFGKLFSELGPLTFGQLCRFKSVDATVRGLMDRAITQRMRA